MVICYIYYHMNLNENIRRVKEVMGIYESEMTIHLRRRFSKEELDNLVADIENQIISGESRDTAIYDTIRNLIAIKDFTDIDNLGSEQDYWDSYLKYETPLVKYVKQNLKV